MGSFTNNGLIPEDDPRYEEGISIMIPLGINRKPGKDPENSDELNPKYETTNQQSEKNKHVKEI